MTKEEAIELHDSEFWVEMTLEDIAKFQMFEEKLCMPFDVFHEAIEKTLGRPVFTHEFGLNYAGIKKELLGEAEAPTTEEIIHMIPEEKRIIVAGPAR